ncbi:MAG: hypothetical protein J5936_01990 [Acholeplasmatales bacterium]|nr:hypothetical protein [Acholeplasmatales bacterium]
MAATFTKKEKQNIIIRLLILAALIVVIVICVVIIVNNSKTKGGINEISNDSSKYSGQMSDFKFYYNLDEENAGATQLKLEREYTSAFDKIYELVSEYDELEGIYNVYYINNHINEDISLEPVLYNYLKKIYDLNPKYLLSAPLYDYWEGMIYSKDLNQRNNIEPENNIEITNSLDYFMNTSLNNISISFLDSYKIRVNVNDDYKKIDDGNPYISLSLFYDSVIMDYIKSYLAKSNLSDGYIISSNGFYLDLGLTIENRILLTSKEYQGGYYSLSCEKGNNYICLYNYKPSVDYPYYEYNDAKRSLFINYNTGYSLDIYSSVFYKNGDMIDLLSNVFDYYLNGNNINHLIQKDNKIYTNVKSVSSDSIEVVYE